MKGWRPSACPLGSKPVRALLRANFLPDIGSIGLSLSAGPWAHGPWTPVPFSRSSAPRPPGRANGAHASAIRKRRQPFTCQMRQEEPGAKTRGNDTNPKPTSSAHAAVACLRSAATKKLTLYADFMRSIQLGATLQRVIPANAGIESSRLDRCFLAALRSRSWMPACAGMTRPRGGRRKSLKWLGSTKESDGF